MRDPKRISKICKLIEEAWSKAPDQRLGQFLSNYVYGHHVDIFFKRDKDVEYMLRLALGDNPEKNTRKKR